jgi:hypothetical protein
MWVMTQEGFYSVVEYSPSMERGEAPKAQKGSLLVRARVLQDLEALGKYVPGLTIQRDDSADYAFRSIVPRAEWTAFLIAAVEEVDYGNFKNRVASRQGEERAGIYHMVWSALLALKRLRDTRSMRDLSDSKAQRRSPGESGRRR